jgi:hypothetical protein
VCEIRALMHESSPSPPLGNLFDSSMPLDSADDNNPNMPGEMVDKSISIVVTWLYF